MHCPSSETANVTYYVGKDAKSSMQDGIETVLFTIRHPHDLQHLTLNTERGVHAVVEWLLSQLGRSTEIDRVCGLTCTPDRDKVVVNLEMRQPGRQIEAWMRSLPPSTGGHVMVLRMENGGAVIGYEDSLWTLSPRSLSPEKFTDKHTPWWIPAPFRMQDGA